MAWTRRGRWRSRRIESQSARRIVARSDQRNATPQPVALLQELCPLGVAAGRDAALVFDDRGADEDVSIAERSTPAAQIDVFVVQEPTVVEATGRTEVLGAERDRSTGEQLELVGAEPARVVRLAVVDVGPGAVGADLKRRGC